MKPISFEWIAKAEGDFATAQRELGATDHPNYDAVCFHAQRCADLDEAREAFSKCENVRDVLRGALHL